MSHIVAAHGTFEIVRTLPPGRAVRIIESPGRCLVQFRVGQVSAELVWALNAYHRQILGRHWWMQDWSDAYDGCDACDACDGQPTAADPRETAARARYVIVPEEALPQGLVCFPIEVAHEFIWLVKEGHMLEGARREMNEYLERAVGGGLWRQQGA